MMKRKSIHQGAIIILNAYVPITELQMTRSKTDRTTKDEGVNPQLHSD